MSNSHCHAKSKLRAKTTSCTSVKLTLLTTIIKFETAKCLHIHTCLACSEWGAQAIRTSSVDGVGSHNIGIHGEWRERESREELSYYSRCVSSETTSWQAGEVNGIIKDVSIPVLRRGFSDVHGDWVCCGRGDGDGWRGTSRNCMYIGKGKNEARIQNFLKLCIQLCSNFGSKSMFMG